MTERLNWTDGSSVFSFLEDPPCFLCRGCTNLHSLTRSFLVLVSKDELGIISSSFNFWNIKYWYYFFITQLIEFTSKDFCPWAFFMGIVLIINSVFNISLLRLSMVSLEKVCQSLCSSSKWQHHLPPMLFLWWWILKDRTVWKLLLSVFSAPWEAGYLSLKKELTEKGGQPCCSLHSSHRPLFKVFLLPFPA